MVKVEMPRGQWDAVLILLEELETQGYYVKSLIKEISTQVYSQEY